MKLIFENWRSYLEELTEEDVSKIQSNIFIFENNKPQEYDFDVLIERFDQKQITVEQIYEIWEKSIVYEMDQLAILEEGVLDWTKEKLAAASDSVKKQWAASLKALVRKAATFVIKILKQAMAFAAKFFSKLKGSYDEVGRGGYIAAMNLARKLIRGGLKVAKVLGPFVVVVGCVMVVSIAFGGTAHAAASGMPPDPELTRVASEILFESFQALGGIEALEADTIESYSNIVTLDGEVARTAYDPSADMGMSEANKQVDALKAITDALHQKITVDGKQLNLQEIMKYYNDADVNETIELALEASRDLKILDPEVYQELLQTSQNNPLDIEWYGRVQSDISSVSTVSSVDGDVTGAGTFTNKIKTTGVDVPVRTNESIVSDWKSYLKS